MSRGASLAVLLLLVAGCAASRPRSERDAVIERILASAVQLRVERESGARATGSGVVLASRTRDARSWILTTRHVLGRGRPPQVSVSSPGRGGRLRAEVVAVSDELDLAVVEVRGVALPPARLQEAAHLGEPVWVLGFPWGRRLTLVSGVVSQIASEDDTPARVGPARMVDAPVSYGSSGAGVFAAADGGLVGIVEGYRTARLKLPSADNPVDIPVPGETTVISTRTILRFLETAGLAEVVSGE